ncbi:MAG: DUF305 domain-containing protein [Pseudonocardia sp.]
MHVKKTAGLLTAVAATFALAACGNTTTPPADSAAPPAAGAGSGSEASAANNEADVAFVRGMIPHHAQAVEMAELAAEQAASQQAKDLASTIEQAQDPEIEQMRGFLRAWGQPAEPAPSGGMGGMDHGGMSGAQPGMPGMRGMMSGQQMQQLEGASGAAFDRMFLQMMIEHHTGAIEMAEVELRDGQNADAKALAQKIIEAQRAEITQMRELLTTV